MTLRSLVCPQHDNGEYCVGETHLWEIYPGAAQARRAVGGHAVTLSRTLLPSVCPQWQPNEEADPREGDSVEFEIGQGPKGPRAENVRRTST